MEGSVEALRPGDHAALIYATRAEQFSVIAPFVKIGLERRERCFYIAHENSIPLVLEKFAQIGVDVAAAQASGALTVATKHETYHKHGLFQPEKMISDLRAEVDKALKSGFSGLRATGEIPGLSTLRKR